jgi:hypothetical protein
LATLRIRAAGAKHLAWTAVLAAMLLIPVWTTWGPRVGAPVLPGATEFLTVEMIEPGENVAPVAGAATPQGLPSAPSALLPPRVPEPFDWQPTLIGIYAAGLLLMGVRLAIGMWRTRGLVRRAAIDEGMLVSAECASPVTVGWWKPVVILPRGWRAWSAEELDAVLTHEREHIRRRDPLVQWLALCNRAIFWFHPLAWWLERQLAALAEDACDVAVLRTGHDPRLYSRFLVELARSVERAGARVTLVGTAMHGGSLADRIRSILEGRSEVRTPRKRAWAAAVLCALMVVGLVACKLEKAAPGQPTMREMYMKRAEKGVEDARKLEADQKEIESMTPEQAQELEKQVKTSPDVRDKVWKLMRFYQRNVDMKGIIGLDLWLIENRPEQGSWSIHPDWDAAAYAKGKQMWLAHVKKAGASPAVYRNAAAYLEGGDKPLAEEILLAGQKAYPEEKWYRELGQHYGQALIAWQGTSDGARRPELAETPYAQEVRAKLEKTNDAKLLAYTAQGLLVAGRPKVPPIAGTYLERALAIQPEMPEAKHIQDIYRGFRQGDRAVDLMRMPPEQRAGLNTDDRLLLELAEMRQAWHRSPEDAEKKARALLDQVGSHPKEGTEAQAVIEANHLLGKLAMQRGDKATAERHLRAIAAVPYRPLSGYLDMNLARALVDAGEREAVAKYLDAMSSKLDRGPQLKEWAAQIRQGINPDLLPTFSQPGCTRGPC